MAFGFNFFNKPKQEAPKGSIKETAKEIAGDAAKLSAAAIALVGALDSATVDAKDTIKEKFVPEKTIPAKPAASLEMDSAISWEDMQKISHEVDSLGHVEKKLQIALDKVEKDSTVIASTFQNYFDQLHAKYGKEIEPTQDVLQEIEATILQTIQEKNPQFLQLVQDGRSKGVSDEQIAKILGGKYFIAAASLFNHITGEDMKVLGEKGNNFTFAPTTTITGEQDARAGLLGTNGLLKQKAENVVLKYIQSLSLEQTTAMKNEKQMQYTAGMETLKKVQDGSETAQK